MSYQLISQDSNPRVLHVAPHPLLLPVAPRGPLPLHSPHRLLLRTLQVVDDVKVPPSQGQPVTIITQRRFIKYKVYNCSKCWEETMGEWIIILHILRVDVIAYSG